MKPIGRPRSLDSGTRYRELRAGLKSWIAVLNRKPDRPVPAGEVAGTLRVLLEAADSGRPHA